MAAEVCAACGKNVERLTVHEGDRWFHLDCYVNHKHRRPPVWDPRHPRFHEVLGLATPAR